jgi:hypothetical protein
MQTLDHCDYLALREGAAVLEADGTGDKVLRLTDGSILKLFRRKRLITSAAWYPYARRFADNCRTLAERDIPCPKVLKLYRIAQIARDAVHYAPLPGLTLRQVMNTEQDQAALRQQLGSFIAELHSKGIYFRSAHLGNIVCTPEGRLGLIDIADLRTFSRPLSKRQRLRNFKHMLRYKEDRQWLLGRDEQRFVTAYLSSQNICNAQELECALS